MSEIIDRSGGMDVLGLDMGSVATGYALLRRDEDGKVSIVESGTLRIPKGEFNERLLWLYRTLKNLLGRVKPDIVAVERPIHARNIKTALTMGMLHSLALLAAQESGIPVEEYEPSVIKKAVTGSGRASKQQVLRMVSMLFGEDAPSLDAADAVATALCLLHRRNL